MFAIGKLFMHFCMHTMENLS